MLSVIQNNNDILYYTSLIAKNTIRKNILNTNSNNIPVSNSILHDLEYNNTVSLYSTYKNKLNKRRSYSENNSYKFIKE
jgi:hypothetical protein